MLLWVGESTLGVAHYAADAVVMRLPLLGGDDSIHDWHYLLNVTGTLNYTATIAGIIGIIGIATIVFATALGIIGTVKKDAR